MIDDDVDVVLDERWDETHLLLLIDEYRRGAIGGGPWLLLLFPCVDIGRVRYMTDDVGGDGDGDGSVECNDDREPFW